MERLLGHFSLGLPMHKLDSELADCYVLIPTIFYDDRGKFTKTFHKDTFEKLNLWHDFQEEYFSVSHKNVLRGLHFQLPPNDHVKCVFCISGKATDVVVDLRVDSKTYGKHVTFNLSPEIGNMVYIPKGMAHGFIAEEDNTIMIYKTSTVHSQTSDYGLRWNSIGIDWPRSDYIISDKDKRLVTFEDFDSPFKME